MTTRLYIPPRPAIDALGFVSELARFTGSALVAFVVMSATIAAVSSWGTILGHALGVLR